MKASLRLKVFVVLTMLAISGLAVAQDQADPPSRVARLQFMEGLVSLQPGGVDDWVDANLNRPLTTADRIWTDRDSRAELSLASAALRLGSETSVTIVNLDDNTAQIELDQGVLNLSVRYLHEGEIVEVDTPNFAYTVSRPGEYRFDVLADEDQSWITVRRGDGEASGENNAQVEVRGGQRFSFSSGQSLSYTNSWVPDPDGFDSWCEVRERQETSSRSAGYVAAGTVGYEDLDANGYWEPSPIYGNMWYPNVHPGWAPYREGHWAWVEPWGWTWVDDAPWGFAPFHYGRWVAVGGRWGWVPGPVGVRPVYAPALVAWVGGPSFGVSLGFGGGGVAWVPLGWHDPFIPSYHVSAVYARNVNISNSRVVNVTVVNNYYATTNVNIRNTTINNIHYENAAVNGAVTGVSNSTFASGRPLRGNTVVVPASAVGRGSVMTSAAVVPTKEAVLGGHAPATAPARMVAPRQVFSKAAPPPRPVSFEQQRPLLEKSNGAPLSPEVRSNLRKSAPVPTNRGGQPAGNQVGGSSPRQLQPGSTQPGRPTVINQPSGNPTAGNVHGQPNNPSNTYGRTPQPGSPTNLNGVRSGEPVNAPAANIARPPQAGNTPGNGNQVNPQRTPVWTNENIGHTPANTDQSGQGKTVVPARPASPLTTPRATVPAQPPHNPPPAGRTAEPAPQHRNAPPPKENNKDKEKDKEPRGR
jgi:hypothetical protein